jgi:hypothetical protein
MPRIHTTSARTKVRILKNGISILRISMEKPITRIPKQKAVTGFIVSKPGPMLLKKVRSKNQPAKFRILTEKTNRREIQIRRESELGLLNISGFRHFLWSD